MVRMRAIAREKERKGIEIVVVVIKQGRIG